MLVAGKAAGGQHLRPHALAVEVGHVQTLGRDVQPGVPLGRGEAAAQETGRAVGLVRLCRALARGLLLGLLALPVRAGKGVDGIVTGDVRLLRFGVSPRAQPVGGGKASFKGSLAPCAGLVILVPQAHLPRAAQARARDCRGIGVHGAARGLAALPEGLATRGQLNFIGRLAHAVRALPGQKQRPGVHAEGRCQMVGL